MARIAIRQVGADLNIVVPVRQEDKKRRGEFVLEEIVVSNRVARGPISFKSGVLLLREQASPAAGNRGGGAEVVLSHAEVERSDER
jgi:hypothetical protein